MEMKNVDLAILNEIAIKIQTSASMGFDYAVLRINCNQFELRNIKLLLKNLGYEIASAPSLMIYFRSPQQGSYISTPIKILTAVDAYQLAEKNKCNVQVVDDYLQKKFTNHIEILIYKTDEINLNRDFLNYFKQQDTKVYKNGNTITIIINDYLRNL